MPLWQYKVNIYTYNYMCIYIDNDTFNKTLIGRFSALIYNYKNECICMFIQNT